MWNAARSGMENPRSGTVLQFIGMNNADVAVSHERAFMVAAVWACIDVVSASLAASDWNVYSGLRGGGDKQALESDTLQYILNTRFNPEMTAQRGKRAMMIAASGYGNGYAEIERDRSQRIIALWPISPDRCWQTRDETTGRAVLRVTQTAQGRTVDLDMELDVFHIGGASLTGLCGDDMIAKAVHSIGMAVAVEQFGATYFANGTQLGGVLEYPGKLDDPAYDRLDKQFNAKHRGSGKSFKTAILGGGLKFTAVSSDAQKAQLIEAKNQIVEEVCRWFRVPPHKVAHLLRSTNNNIEHQGLEFSRDTLRPWVKEIEQEADFKLFPSRSARKFIEIDVDWASEGDFKSRMEAYASGINTGVYSPNHVLRKLGENTIGAAGDVRMVQGAMMRLEDVGKNMLPAPAQPAAPDAAATATATAWLTSVYVRIQRQCDNRAADLERSGHADSMVKARAAARPYAAEQIEELAAVLGDRVGAAHQWAVEVINGCEPKVAAAAAMEGG